MKESMTRRGLLGLAFWHNGMKQMSANKPLMVPSDAKGLKFRVQNSDVLKAQMAAMGASPQPMAFSEVYGALQTGVVDGQENTWSNIYGQKFFEVQDGTTETNHGVLDYMLVTSTDWWDSLDADVRDQLATIVKEVTDTRNSESSKVNADAKQAIIDAARRMGFGDETCLARVYRRCGPGKHRRRTGDQRQTLMIFHPALCAG